MDNDLYVDCPSCGHTVKVANDLIGARVDCPDCSVDFEVPDIRVGLNPRFRREKSNTTAPGYDLPDLGDLHAGLKSLLRRNRAQVEQIDFLTENSDLLLKQVNMLTPSSFPKAAEGTTPQPRTADANPIWFRWSLICGCISIAAALVVAVLLLM